MSSKGFITGKKIIGEEEKLFSILKCPGNQTEFINANNQLKELWDKEYMTREEYDKRIQLIYDCFPEKCTDVKPIHVQRLWDLIESDEWITK